MLHRGKLGVVLVMAMACLAVAPQARAEEAEAAKDWSAELTLDYYSKYVWRGILLTDDSVFQPGVSFGWKGLSVSVWGNMDLTDVNGNDTEVNEVDYTVAYEREVGPLTLGVGTIFYDFPNTDFASTQEVYASVGVNCLLSPTLAVYRDIDEVEGFYVTLGVSHSLEKVIAFSENVTMGVDLGAEVSWGDKDYNLGYFGVDDSGFNALTLSASLPIAIGEHVSVTPGVNWSTLIDSDIQASTDDDDNFWAGVSVGFSF
ncbi:hypothetical protein HQ576_16245 [bacterium]|nr:hypothetical protein [bacterium]